MFAIQRRIYCAALFLWVLSVVLFPTWIGRSYSRLESGSWHESGVFGLYGAEGWFQIRPLWNPPRALADIAGEQRPAGAPNPRSDGPSPRPVSVRWPFQPIRAGQYPDHASVIEVSWLANAIRLGLGVLVLGVLLRAWTWSIEPRQVDALVATAWSVSLGLVIAALCVMVVGLFSMGLLLNDPVVVCLLSAGVLGGVGYQVWSSRAAHPLQLSAAEGLSGAAAEESTIAPADSTRVSRRTPQQAAPLASTIFWFTAGMIAAFCLMLAIASLANFFRGPAVGVNELGGTRYARDQRPVDIATGVALIATGCLGAAALRQFGAPRGLVWGLAIGMTAMGILSGARF